MAFQELPQSDKVIQVLPEKKQLSLQGLYLGQRLAEMSAKIKRALVIANFLTGRNGVVGKTDEHSSFSSSV